MTMKSGKRSVKERVVSLFLLPGLAMFTYAINLGTPRDENIGVLVSIGWIVGPPVAANLASRVMNIDVEGFVLRFELYLRDNVIYATSVFMSTFFAVSFCGAVSGNNVSFTRLAVIGLFLAAVGQALYRIPKES
jgi:hypothetical protein